MAGTMIGQIDLGNRLTNLPVLNVLTTCKNSLNAVLSEFSIRKFSQNDRDIRHSLIVK